MARASPRALKVPVGLAPSLFEQHVGVAAAGEHGRPAFTEGHGRDVRKNSVIAPHAGPLLVTGIGSYGVANGCAFCRSKVIAHIEGSGTVRAYGLWGGGVLSLVAARAFEVGNRRHSRRITNAARSIQAQERMTDTLSNSHRPARSMVLPVLVASGLLLYAAGIGLWAQGTSGSFTAHCRAGGAGCGGGDAAVTDWLDVLCHPGRGRAWRRCAGRGGAICMCWQRSFSGW